MTPRRYLAAHPLTAHLKSLGLSRAQLDGVRYRRFEGFEFADWTIISTIPWPSHLTFEQRVWCALRWLVLDDPVHSRDSRDAWELIARYLKHVHDSQVRNATNIRAAQTAANNKRKAQAEQRALTPYRAWVARVAAELRALTPAARLRKYSKVKKPPQRQQRHLRALLNRGEI